MNGKHPPKTWPLSPVRQFPLLYQRHALNDETRTRQSLSSYFIFEVFVCPSHFRRFRLRRGGGGVRKAAPPRFLKEKVIPNVQSCHLCFKGSRLLSPTTLYIYMDISFEPGLPAAKRQKLNDSPEGKASPEEVANTVTLSDIPPEIVYYHIRRVLWNDASWNSCARKRFVRYRLVCKAWSTIFIKSSQYIEIPKKKQIQRRALGETIDELRWDDAMELEALHVTPRIATSLLFNATDPVDHKFILGWLTEVHAVSDQCSVRFERGLGLDCNVSFHKAARPKHQLQVPQGVTYPRITVLLLDPIAEYHFLSPKGIYHNLLAAMPCLHTVVIDKLTNLREDAVEEDQGLSFPLGVTRIVCAYASAKQVFYKCLGQYKKAAPPFVSFFFFKSVVRPPPTPPPNGTGRGKKIITPYQKPQCVLFRTYC